jgi:dihydrolipoamide dehydrogenase
MSTSSFDLVVIGSGPGGYRAAVLAAARGMSTAIVEKDAWGGACLNRGCVPKKAWYQTARLLGAARHFAGRGVSGALVPDLAGAWRRQREIVQAVRASYTDYLERLGVRRREGVARFIAADRIDVNGEILIAGNVVVASGSRPRLPRALASSPRVLTTDDLFEKPLPNGRRVALIGSGAVGVEMAYILSALGLEIVWLTGREPLPEARYSQPGRSRLREALAVHGVAPRTRSRPTGCFEHGGGLELRLPDGTERVDWLLAGTGRVPNTVGLGLEAAGVELTRDGFVRVDGAQRTSNARVFAIGDCANPAMTANHALAEASIALAEIARPGAARPPRAWVPEVLYSALELARVGETEDELEEAGREYAVGFSAFAANPAALGEGDAGGYVRLLVDAGDGALLGCEIAGPQAGELVHLAQPGSGGESLLARLGRERFNHPSRAEELLNAAEGLVGRWGLDAGAE